MRINQKFSTMIIIIGAMIEKLLSLFVVLIVFLLSFAASDYVAYSLQKADPMDLPTNILNYLSGSLGNIDFTTISNVGTHIDHWAPLGSYALVLFIFATVIVLLNLLISVMLEAYDSVRAISKARWCYVQFEMIMELEDEIGEDLGSSGVREDDPAGEHKSFSVRLEAMLHTPHRDNHSINGPGKEGDEDGDDDLDPLLRKLRNSGGGLSRMRMAGGSPEVPTNSKPRRKSHAKSGKH